MVAPRCYEELAALTVLARSYLSQAPGMCAEAVEDLEVEATLRALGYTGD